MHIDGDGTFLNRLSLNKALWDVAMVDKNEKTYIFYIKKLL